jgi:hypothetical protein
MEHENHDNSFVILYLHWMKKSSVAIAVHAKIAQPRRGKTHGTAFSQEDMGVDIISDFVTGKD